MQKGVKLGMDGIARVVSLLRSTDLDLNHIAERMGVSFSTVSRINIDYKVRIYKGSTKWTIGDELVDRGLKQS